MSELNQVKADAVVFRLNAQDEIRVKLDETIYLHFDHQGKRTVDAMNQQEKQEFLDKAKAIMAATLGKEEALRMANEVANAINTCLFDKFPDINTGVAAVVMDSMVSNMIERALETASHMGQGRD